LKSISYSAGDTITVTYSGDSNYNSSSTQGKIGAVAQTVTWNTTSASYSQSGLNISSYSSTNGDGSLTYDISDIGTTIAAFLEPHFRGRPLVLVTFLQLLQAHQLGMHQIQQFQLLQLANQIKQSLLDR
jgi:hypothetical protein